MIKEQNCLADTLTLLLFSHSVVSESLRPHGLQHARLLCPSPSTGACSNSCPLSQWYHLVLYCPLLLLLSILPSIRIFSSGLFTSGGQGIGASALASVLLMNIQDWFPLGLIGLISLLSKGLSRVFSNTTVQKHQFSGVQPSLWSNSHIHGKTIALTIQTFVGKVMSLLFNILSRFAIAFLPRSKH